jgi:acetyl-CoA carboxylase alpha subunit
MPGAFAFGQPRFTASPLVCVRLELSNRRMKHQLEFEKPILELQRKLEELRRHPEKHSMGLSFEDEIVLMEKKLEETRRQVYTNLSAWERVQMARHPRRPFTLDYLGLTFTEFSELHGDRLYADDNAVVGGFAKLDGRKVVVRAPKRVVTPRKTSAAILARRTPRATARPFV